jgi:hypothetical protein
MNEDKMRRKEMRGKEHRGRATQNGNNRLGKFTQVEKQGKKLRIRRRVGMRRRRRTGITRRKGMYIDTENQQVPYAPDMMSETITWLAFIILTRNKSEIIS